MPKAKNLKYCRIKAKMTQQSFAEAIGADRSTINAWENRKRAIPAPSARKIADFFAVDYNEFCDTDLERMDRKITGEEIRLSDSEVENILLFRELPDNVKEWFRYMVRQAHKLEVVQNEKDS